MASVPVQRSKSAKEGMGGGDRSGRRHCTREAIDKGRGIGAAQHTELLLLPHPCDKEGPACMHGYMVQDLRERAKSAGYS
jgi:hypothetical protein